MGENIKELLNEEIAAEIQAISSLDSGSEKKSKAMCYIQLSLLGVAAYIKVGDVFTQPMSTDDNGENYWFTMMYFSDVWTMRRVFHSL